MASSFHISQEADKAHLRKNKIRKPVIEKMRRDRINHSIEQLRELLEKDIQSQHSKLEKADILEMAVKYLRQKKLHQNDSQDLYYQGYYMCLKETVGFLHSHGQAQAKILRQICRQQSQSTGEHSLQYPPASPERSPPLMKEECLNP
ncbi:PREDICTED: transcription factor HES-5-like [Nanorana parkeri]|uniref:transcription factor HES-5-like n=1 Tax=Nanorana parkeri TaxID=125878 RepID=UPI000854076D|nr:PREDICTED: transcription factor HES-5-like [Nanorana parkeri]